MIPLTEYAVRTLENVCETAPEDLVFWHQNEWRHPPKPFIEFKNFWGSLRNRAGLEGLRFHDLRHTFASWWVQSGGDLVALKNILGHSSMQMAERYAHFDTKAAKRAIEDIEFPHNFRTLEEISHPQKNTDR